MEQRKQPAKLKHLPTISALFSVSQSLQKQCIIKEEVQLSPAIWSQINEGISREDGEVAFSNNSSVSIFIYLCFIIYVHKHV